MMQLEIRDNRGKDPNQVNKLAIILTDTGFKVTNNGNEVIDATTIREDGTFTINTNIAKIVKDCNGYIEHKCFLW